MLATLGALLLCAAPIKVAVPGFTVIGIERGLGEAWAEHFVTLLGRDDDFVLITSKDIAQVLGLERQKQLLGCNEAESSCLAELAGALGVDAILSGTFAQSGSSITATLRMLKATDGTQIATVTHRLKDADALQDWLDAQAPELLTRMRTAFSLGQRSQSPMTISAQVSTGTPVVRWVPAIIGGGTAIGGAVLFGLSKGHAAQLRTQALSADEITTTASNGRTFEGAGLGLLIGGAVAIATTVVWMLLMRCEVGVALIPTSAGATAVVGGSF